MPEECIYFSGLHIVCPLTESHYHSLLVAFNHQSNRILTSSSSASASASSWPLFFFFFTRMAQPCQLHLALLLPYTASRYGNYLLFCTLQALSFRLYFFFLFCLWDLYCYSSKGSLSCLELSTGSPCIRHGYSIMVWCTLCLGHFCQWY